MEICLTEPQEKMPADCELSHDFHVNLRIDCSFIPNQGFGRVYLGDLTKYYYWTNECGMKLEHNILRYGENGQKTLIMFVFENETDAMGFKLRWL